MGRCIIIDPSRVATLARAGARVNSETQQRVSSAISWKHTPVRDATPFKEVKVCAENKDRESNVCVSDEDVQLNVLEDQHA